MTQKLNTAAYTFFVFIPALLMVACTVWAAMEGDAVYAGLLALLSVILVAAGVCKCWERRDAIASRATSKQPVREDFHGPDQG